MLIILTYYIYILYLSLPLPLTIYIFIYLFIYLYFPAPRFIYNNSDRIASAICGFIVPHIILMLSPYYASPTMIFICIINLLCYSFFLFFDRPKAWPRSGKESEALHAIPIVSLNWTYINKKLDPIARVR